MEALHSDFHFLFLTVGTVGLFLKRFLSLEELYKSLYSLKTLAYLKRPNGFFPVPIDRSI